MALTATDIARLRYEAQQVNANEIALAHNGHAQNRATFNGQAAGQMLGRIDELEQEVKQLKQQLSTFEAL